MYHDKNLCTTLYLQMLTKTLTKFTTHKYITFVYKCFDKILQHTKIINTYNHSGNALLNSSLHAGGKFVGNTMLNFTSKSPFCPGDFDIGIPSLGIL